MTARYPTTRHLTADDSGARACALVHHRDGIHVHGVTVGEIADAELLRRSNLAELHDAITAERDAAHAELGTRDVDALAVRRWHLDTSGATIDVTVELDIAPLSHWIASRTVFARQPIDTRLAHTHGAPLGIDPLAGTHLGYTATVVTADGYLAVVRRTAKLLADGLLDSAIGDTAVANDCADNGELDMHALISNAGLRYLGLTPDQLDLRVALLAVRVDDSGLWVSGHAHATVTRDELRETITERSAHPDPDRVVFLPWNTDTPAAARQLGAWTSWGLADLESAASVDFGPDLQTWQWVALP